MSSVLDLYLGLMDSLTWKSRTSVNEYNEPSYSTSTIYAKVCSEKRMVRSGDAETLQEFTYLITTSAVEEGDSITINGLTWPVISVQIKKNFEGEQYRKVNLGDRRV